jgi:hypothetical protein
MNVADLMGVSPIDVLPLNEGGLDETTSNPGKSIA